MGNLHSESIIKDQYIELRRKQDNQLIEKLAEQGFKVDNFSELVTLLSLNGRIEKHQDSKLMELFVGNKLIMSWYDNYEMTQESQPDGSMKFILTYGNKPKEIQL